MWWEAPITRSTRSGIREYLTWRELETEILQEIDSHDGRVSLAELEVLVTLVAFRVGVYQRRYHVHREGGEEAVRRRLRHYETEQPGDHQ